MKIGIVGSGAIGGAIASLLDRAGHEVAVTARGAHRASIRRDGLTLAGAWGEHTARLRADETLQEAPELAFVCTKAQDAAEAIRANREALASTRVAVVQNGLTGLQDAVRLLPEAECAGGIALYAASHVSPGAVTVTTAGLTYLGAGPTGSEETVRIAAGILGPVMPVETTDNFIGCQWTKLIVNQVNALPAITGLSVQETLADNRLRRIVTLSMRETVRTGIAAGVRFGAIQGLSDGSLRGFVRVPWWIGQVLPAIMRRRMGDVPNPGSTLQSIRRGRRTEIDHINGAVVEAARGSGRTAPINAALVDLVHEVEGAGTFITPAAVVERVRTATLSEPPK